MLASEILTDVRENLSDSASSRWTTPVLLRCLTDAVMQIFEARSDLLLTEQGTLLDPLEVEDATDEIELPDSMHEALALLTTGKALGQDSDDRTNLERAAFYEKQAMGRVLRGG